MSNLATRWECPTYSVAAADHLRGELGVSAAVAAILVRRGHDTVPAALRFLRAEERHDPFLFAGMDAVCAKILGHVERGSRIVVHGDYDVDGVCSTAIVVRALRALGADPAWLIPSRLDDGYGLTLDTVARLERERAELVITADCAITSVREVDAALARGIDMVVTDHHQPGDSLPACPVVHPALCGYPFPDLCAAAVAHKLVEALHRSAGRDPAILDEDLDLVALATVADLVPLRGENRRLVRMGLRALERTKKPGLRALLRVSGADAAPPNEETLGFRLAPRLNAAGRLQRADAALELLLTDDTPRAAEVADELDLLNRERRDTEIRITAAAEAALAEQAEAPAYVLAGEGWHPGVIGIVASRIVERYHRPCVVISLAPEGGRGSGRSISGYDLLAGLSACSQQLRQFGGHRMAAGLEIDADQVDAFRAALAADAASKLAPEDLVPRERVDALVPGAALGLPLAEELERLRPFGSGNPRPRLLVPAARVEGVAPMGKDRAHARFTLSSGEARARAVAFRTSPRALAAAAEGPLDLAVTLEPREWNGIVEPSVVLRAACATEGGACEELTPDCHASREESFWSVFERELRADPEQWPWEGEEGVPPLDPAPEPEPARGAAGARRLCDRRGEGLAGVAGELIASGETVLLVCADVPRRRRALADLLGGIGAGTALLAVSWETLAGSPDVAAPFDHLVALDPPPLADGEVWLIGAPGRSRGARGSAHLAWGAHEVEFARACAREQLDLRDSAAELYRALRAAGTLSGAKLESALRGAGPHVRKPALAARLVRILGELGLVHYGQAAGEERLCRVLEAARTSCERSSSYLAYRARLAQAESYLAGQAAALARPCGQASGLPLAVGNPPTASGGTPPAAEPVAA